jgi:transposase
MSIADFVNLEGFKVKETFKHLDQGYVLVAVEPLSDQLLCRRCGECLEGAVGRHRIRAKYLPIFNYESYVVCWRRKGHCPQCKKIRSEDLGFLSEDSPHLTKAFESTIEELTEIAAVSRVADYTGEDKSTVWRLDFRRLLRFRSRYKIPPLTHISVDEVYARKKHKEGETRNDRFVTVITDMKSRKVVWVADSRRREALDEFYQILGKARCDAIKVVAQDQHEDYRASTREHCPNAKIVYDKFHVIKSFNDAMNEARKFILKAFDLKKQEKKKLMGKFKYVLSKSAAKRSDWEKQSLAEAAKVNELITNLEIIKESVLNLFDHENLNDAEKHFDQLQVWIHELGFPSLKSWYNRLASRWDCIAAYYSSPTTSALSEGVNNVIKTLKRRAYGYRNMEYFKLKIMQICGYLTTDGMKQLNDLGSLT